VLGQVGQHGQRQRPDLEEHFVLPQFSLVHP
jgi:hypothetical protein